MKPLTKQVLTLGACLLAIAMPRQDAAALGVSLDAPGPPVLQIGDGFALDVRVSGLGDGVPPALRSFDINVSFDGDVVQLDLANSFFDLHLGVAGTEALTSSGILAPGLADFASVSLLPASALTSAQPDAFRLVHLAFLAIGEGDAGFGLPEQIFGAIGGIPLQVDSLAVSSVRVVLPEPTTALLVGASLLGLAIGRYRRP